MTEMVNIPIFGPLASKGFRYGSLILVEYEAHSLWYETSLTIAANALKNGLATDYHTFQRPPKDVRDSITKLGVDVEKEEEAKRFRIIDSYDCQLGVAAQQQEKRGGLTQGRAQETLAVSDWREPTTSVLTAEQDEIIEKNRLHIDDNTSALLSANDEKSVNDFWLKIAGITKKYGLIMINSVCTGCASQAFYNKFESIADAIVDFTTKEGEEVEHLIRMRVVRGVSCDSRWKTIKLNEAGESILLESRQAELGQGLSGWLKGRQK
jgi:KaiC/GvpD/RAD55 family RecA-like ATPase